MNTITKGDNEAQRATVTFHTSSKTKARLDKLATVTNRSKSFLTNKAVELYLAQEEDFITAVHAGIDDVEAGNVHTDQEVRSNIAKAVANTK